MVDNENNKDQKKTNSRSNSANPFFGMRHSYETKQKMSVSQKKRYANMRKVVDEERIKQITESPNMYNLIKRVVNEALMRFCEK